MSRGDAGGLGVPGAHGEHLTPTGCSAARGHAGAGERLAQTHWAPSAATVWRLAWFPLSPGSFYVTISKSETSARSVLLPGAAFTERFFFCVDAQRGPQAHWQCKAVGESRLWAQGSRWGQRLTCFSHHHEFFRGTTVGTL